MKDWNPREEPIEITIGNFGYHYDSWIWTDYVEIPCSAYTSPEILKDVD